MQSGWRIGSLFGIPIFLEPSLFIFLAILTLWSEPDWEQHYPDWGYGLALGAGLLTAVLLFGSVLLHELGHSLVAQSQGIKVNSITLFLLGGLASIDQESKTPAAAFQVAIAGPTVSLFLYLMLLPISRGETLPDACQFLAGILARINLILALFNLVPGLPLDGGQVLKAAIWQMTGSRRQGVRWAARTGQVLGWLAVVLGSVAFLLVQQPSFLWIAVIGGFSIRNASAYSRVSDLQEALFDLTASDAMTRDFRVVDGKLTLHQFAELYLLEESRPATYFAASEGRYRGMVCVDDIRNTERSEWDIQTLKDIVRPLTHLPVVHESTPLPTVINQLEAEELRRITVLSPADTVAGVIDRGDIVKTLAQKLDLPIADSMIQSIKEDGTYPPGLQLPKFVRNAEEG